MALKIINLFSAKTTEKSILSRTEQILSRAQSLQRQGQLAPAAAAYQSILERDPEHWESLNAIAAITLLSGDFERAIRLYDLLIGRKRDYAEAYYKRANALNALGRFEAALADYDHAIALNPGYANAFCNRGAVLEHFDRWDEALASYNQAVTLNPDDHLTYLNRGSVLKEMKRLDEALVSYEQAIALKSDYVEAYINSGNVLQELRRFEAAVNCYDKAIKLNPSHYLAYFNRGTALKELKRLDEALGNFDKALALKCTHVESFVNRGNVLQELRCHEAAVVSYNQALALKADQKYLLGMRRHVKMQICDWDNLAPDMEQIARGLEANCPVSTPLAVLALVDSAPLHRLAAEIWVREECPPDNALGSIPARLRSGKIQVGYFSADFRSHAVSALTAELFETHDRSRFEITAFAFGPEANDTVSARLERAFDRFINVRNQSDIEVAMLSRKVGIDIAVDLGGFTEHCRTKIFALRAAPMQISYIGYLGTMGAPYMDYLVADATIIPSGERQHYTEKIMYLPSYQANDSQRRVPDRTFSREELGLPPMGFVFCCFNANYKITPAIFAVWMRILKRVDGSSLFLYADNQVAERNLLKAASRCGVDPRGIVFGKRLAWEEYMARFRTMDLFLDTLPYNAGATASDALWVGLPVLTCSGQAFSSRVAASLLKAIDLPELITDTMEQYEDLAVALATNLTRLAQIRQKLTYNRSVAPLFNTARFTRNLEFAYTQIYERHRAGLPPEHIFSQS